MKQIRQDYETYCATQIEANERKISWVWAKERSIRLAAKQITRRLGTPVSGICHGVRNGQELRWFEAFLPGCTMLGTDISPTARQFRGVIQHDFHEPLKCAADFVYSNSLDHAYDPNKALHQWCLQGRLVVLEWGKDHNKLSETDPFAASLSEYVEMCKAHGKTDRVDVGNGRILLFIQSAQARDTIKSSGTGGDSARNER